MKKYIFILLSCLFISCIPEDTPVEPFDRGDMQIGTAEMGSFYEKQIYYSLKENTFVSENLRTDWDLGFACGLDEFHIILNFSTAAKVVKVEDATFEEIDEDYADNIEEEAWKFDNQFGDRDSTAIGQWWNIDESGISSKKEVFVINRGKSPKAKNLGIVKFQVLDFDNDTYHIRFADVEDMIIHELSIPKDNNYNYKQISFNESGSVLQLEPQKDQWDILFSSFMDLIYTSEGDPLWYQVTSVLINRNGVEAAFLHSEDFAGIDISVVDTLEFSTSIKAIGHEWKWFDLEGSSYTVFDDYVYIVKDVDGFYFKMRFVEFYNESGSKGYPKFELKLL